MIDLTPLEVRKKKGDFRKALRGYEPGLVDDFLDVVADRLDQLVRDNNELRERATRLEQQVTENRERERALTDALVTAQEMREEVRMQTSRESELMLRTAKEEAAQVLRRANQQAEQIRGEALQSREREEEVLRRLRARQSQLLTSYRTFLAREMAELQVIGETLEIEGMGSPSAPTAPATSAAPAAFAPPAALTPPPAFEAPPAPVVPELDEEPFAPEPVDEWDEEAEEASMGAEVVHLLDLDELEAQQAVHPEPDEELFTDPGEVAGDEGQLIAADELALHDGISHDRIHYDEVIHHDDPTAEPASPATPLSASEVDRFAPMSLELSREDDPFGHEAPPEPEVGAPDHDATALLENALKAGYRIDLEDEDDVGLELLLEDTTDDGEDDDSVPPRDWLDTIIDDEER